MRRVPALPLLVVLVLLLAALCAVRLAVGGLGAVGVSGDGGGGGGVGAGWSSDQARALLSLRGVRVLTGVVVGAALALAGVVLQGLLRNPLASPDLLGVASGAGLGVMAAVYASFLAGAGLADPGGFGALGAALLGAGLTLGLVYALGQRRGFIEPTALVLVGVMVGIVCSGVIALLQHLMPDQGVAASRLLVGALRDDARASHLLLAGAGVAGCAIMLQAHARDMDLATLADDEARSAGVALGRLRTVQFACAGVLTACAVVLAGPIGFVGLVAPHAVRLLAGPRHAVLLPGAALLGAACVVGADVLVALVREAQPGVGRLPLSVVTALAGGPVFLWLLRRAERVL